MKKFNLITQVLIVSQLYIMSAQAESEYKNYFVDGPISIINSNLFYGANLGYKIKFNEQIDLGLATGLHYWSKTDAAWTAHQWVIPLLPKAIYHLNTDHIPFKTYFGISAGAAYISTAISLGNDSGSDKTFVFNAYTHIGAEVLSEYNLNFEVKIGLMKSQLMIAPNVQWSF